MEKIRTSDAAPMGARPENEGSGKLVFILVPACALIALGIVALLPV